MYYVYILQNKVDTNLYIGYTHDLKKRLNEHNRLDSLYTKRKAPWEVIYYEAYKSQIDAVGREKQLKRFAQSYTGLKRRIRNCINQV